MYAPVISRPIIEIAVSAENTGKAPRTTMNSETKPFRPGNPSEAMLVKSSRPP